MNDSTLNSLNHQHRPVWRRLFDHVAGSPKAAFISLIAVYFLMIMHYFQHNVGGSGLDIPINPLGWIIISMLVSLGIVQIIQQRRIIYNKYLLIATGCCTFLLIPLLYANEAGPFSHTRLLGLFAGLGVLTAFYQMQFSQQERHKILWLILGGIFLESLFALCQFYVFPFISSLNMNIERPSAIFFQANVAATFFATGLFIALYLLSQNTQLKRLQIIFLLTVSFTSALCVMLLQSRTAFLGVAIGLIIWVLVQRKILISWLLVAIMAIIVALTSFSILDSKLREANVYTDAGLRVEIYADSLATIAQKPLLGHGYGTFSRAFRNYQAAAYANDNNHQQIYNLSHPHNELLLWGVEGGLVSLLPLVILMLASARLFFTKKTILILPLLFPISLHIFTEFPFYHSVASYLVFLILLGLISDNQTSSRQIQVNHPPLIYLLLAVGVSINSLLMINLMQGHLSLTHAIRDQNINNLLNNNYLIMSDNVESAQNELLLKLAIEHKIEIGVTSFISWAAIQKNSYPRANNYQLLLDSYLYLNNQPQREHTLKDAKYLFPTLHWKEKESVKPQVN